MYKNNLAVKKCKYCGEDIESHKTRCPYCGSLLNDKFNDMEDTAGERIPLDEATGDGCLGKPEYIAPANSVSISPLSNGMKVFLTTLTVLIPGIGQIIGLISAVLFVNSDDADRRSFGTALLIAALITFVISILSCFVLVIIFALAASA